MAQETKPPRNEADEANEARDAAQREEHANLRRLKRILDEHGSVAKLDAKDLLDLTRLYRHASSVAARYEAGGRNPLVVAETRHLVVRAHRLLFDLRETEARPLALRLVDLFLVDAPRAIRAEWKLLSLSFALIYGLAIVAWFAVSRDLDLAPSLLHPTVVEGQIEQLQAMEDGEAYRGNFTFGWGESPATAGMVMLNNIGVGILFFASALVPPVYLYILSKNALMLGTYTAVAGHWGEAGSISSILWCHGVLEIQAIVLAGTAGLVLVRAWIRPGPWSRRHALLRESRRSVVLLAPTVPILIIAGLIEGFVSPHAPFAVRIAVAVATGVLLLGWALGSGRSARRDRTQPVTSSG